MKIGILTLPLHTNYGGILQAYALQTVLERMGYEVKVIDKPYSYYLKPTRQVLAIIKRILLRIVFLNKRAIFPERERTRKFNAINKLTNSFISSHLKLLRVNKYKEAKKEGFDAIVVGSDQVWRPEFFGKCEDSFLDFAKNWNITRISYAASFGKDKIDFTNSQIISCIKLLKKFKAISVREASAVHILHETFDAQSVHVLDPTMLLDRTDYIQLASKATPHNGNLLYYILDENEEKNRIIDEICSKGNYKAFRIGGKEWISSDEPLESLVFPSVESWLRGFIDAKMVVTDSFHACVFSIIFHVPFVAIGNAYRGLTRFYDLLGQFGLENRLTTDFSAVSAILSKSIDWESVDKRMEERKEFSFNFLNTLNL